MCVRGRPAFCSCVCMCVPGVSVGANAKGEDMWVGSCARCTSSPCELPLSSCEHVALGMCQSLNCVNLFLTLREQWCPTQRPSSGAPMCVALFSGRDRPALVLPQCTELGNSYGCMLIPTNYSWINEYATKEYNSYILISGGCYPQMSLTCIHFISLPASGGFWNSLVCDSITPVSAYIFTWTCVCMSAGVLYYLFSG